MKFNSETGSKAGKISKRGSALPIDLRGGLIDLVNRILKDKFITIDSKKHYSSTGVYQKEILEVQKNTFYNLSKLSSRIYNLSLIKDS